jgi:7-cyano-7-deazaguanine synthase
MKKAVVALSGGLDSAMLTTSLLLEGYEVRAYAFDYGQRHRIELNKASELSGLLCLRGFPVEFQKINLVDCFSESTSALHSKSQKTIPTGTYKEGTISSTAVENRNVIFSSILYGKALSWANQTGDHVEVCLGIHKGDSVQYPDTTEESRQACEYAYRISNFGSDKVSYYAPFVEFTKGELLGKTYSLMKAFGLKDWEIEGIFRKTHSCYSPNEKGESCGQCSTCIDRLQAFEENSLTDFIKYVTK